MNKRIGSCLDCFAATEFNLVLTLLEPTPLTKESTASGRKIHWISLPLLSDPMDLFKNLKFKITSTMKNCIRACNGHPRSLEAVYKTFEFFGEKLESISYQELIQTATKTYLGGDCYS